MTNIPPPKADPELPPRLKELARQLAKALRQARGDETKDDDNTSPMRFLGPGFPAS